MGITPDHLLPADVDEIPLFEGKLSPAPTAWRGSRRRPRSPTCAATRSSRAPTSWRPIRWSRSAGASLPKAELVDDASQCLRLLSGRNHKVYTAVCLVTPKEGFRQRMVETRVRFKRLSEEDLEIPISPAGNGAARPAATRPRASPARSSSRSLVGSYTNVVGLPLYETVSLLAGEGFPIHAGWVNALAPTA